MTDAPQMTVMGRPAGEPVSHHVKGILSLSRLPAHMARRRALKWRNFGEKPELLFQILCIKTSHTQRPFPPPGGLPNLGIEPNLLHLVHWQAGSLPLAPPGKPLGRSPGEAHGHPLQCSCLENPMDRGAWQATVHGVANSQTRLSN